MKNKNTIHAKSTKEIKLKDTDSRHAVAFNLKRDFGFVPEEIVVEKVRGRNNVIVVSALLTKKELEKIKPTRKKRKGVAKGKKETKE